MERRSCRPNARQALTQKPIDLIEGTLGDGIFGLPPAYLRWRMRARILRFFRPILRRPLPVFFVPTSCDSHQ